MVYIFLPHSIIGYYLQGCKVLYIFLYNILYISTLVPCRVDLALLFSKILRVQGCKFCYFPFANMTFE